MGALAGPGKGKGMGIALFLVGVALWLATIVLFDAGVLGEAMAKEFVFGPIGYGVYGLVVGGFLLVWRSR